jgi:hypothetical protein
MILRIHYHLPEDTAYVSCVLNVLFRDFSGDAVHQSTWLLLLKTEHMVKMISTARSNYPAILKKI